MLTSKTLIRNSKEMDSSMREPTKNRNNIDNGTESNSFIESEIVQ